MYHIVLHQSRKYAYSFPNKIGAHSKLSALIGYNKDVTGTKNSLQNV